MFSPVKDMEFGTQGVQTSNKKKGDSSRVIKFPMETKRMGSSQPSLWQMAAEDRIAITG